jgi:hypothetical protein
MSKEYTFEINRKDYIIELIKKENRIISVFLYQKNPHVSIGRFCLKTRSFLLTENPIKWYILDNIIKDLKQENIIRE